MRMRLQSTRSRAFALLAACLLLPGCGNNPYPEADKDKKVLYSSFNEAPKTLDPAVAYTTAEHVITGNVFQEMMAALDGFGPDEADGAGAAEAFVSRRK